MIKKTILLFFIVILISSTLAKASFYVSNRTPCSDTGVGFGSSVNTSVLVGDSSGYEYFLNFTWYNSSSGNWEIYKFYNWIANGTSNTYYGINTNFTECNTNYSWATNFTYVFGGKPSYYNSSCWFITENCSVLSIYPIDQSEDVCPCSACICTEVYHKQGENMNLSVYHRHTTRGGSYHRLAIFTNKTNGTYCFCLGETLFSPAYVFDHTNYTNATIPVNTWNTVKFNMSHHRIKNIDHSTTVNNDTYTIKTEGEYKLSYQMKFADSAANPVSEANTRILINGVEAHGSLMCDDMKKKDAATIISATVMEYLYVGDKITFEYAATHITVSLTSTCVFGDVPFSASIYINHIDDVGQHPMFYNETYEWYVNVSEYGSPSNYNVSDTYSFTTVENITDCPSSLTDIQDSIKTGGNKKNDILWIIGLFGIVGLAGLFINNRRKK